MWHGVLLGISFFLAFFSERLFPKAYAALNLSTHWLSYLFFRPGQLFISIILYLLALLIIRYVTRFHAKILLGRGNIFNHNSIKSWVVFLLGLLILFILFSRNLLPTLFLTGGLLIYDLFDMYREFRRVKRLKSAFRPSLPE